MAIGRSIFVSQDIETREFIVCSPSNQECYRDHTERFGVPGSLRLEVRQGLGELCIGRRVGDYAWDCFSGLDLDQSLIAFEALQWAVSARQVMEQGVDPAIAALRAMDVPGA